ncbi:MAG: MAPEG family protein [Alphaproteobacteria bacterium]|nr:MAPEG family protein [Alphaproteobacteria bacterium]MBV9541249.1 MAPEG family protein [Alphaproteobacteria bacterium]
MSQNAIFTPMGILAFWTFAVLLLIPFRRFRAGFAGQITPDDFKFGESSNVPGHVTIPNRAMMNLLELPVLFYVVCLMFFVTQTVTPLVLQVAWAYVGFRLAQTLIHITYNNVIHRLTVFAVSNFILVTLWVMFFFPAGK